MRNAATDKPLPQFNQRELGQLFGLHRHTVAARLRKVTPDGQRSEGRGRMKDTWTIPTVAAQLCDRTALLVEIAEDPSELPPAAAKDYWDAKIKEQTFAHREGHLWADEEVLDMFAAVFKPLANKVRAISDTLERRAGLSARQTGVVDEVCDELLREIHDAVASTAGAALETMA